MQIVALDRSFYKLYRQGIAELSPEASERLRLVKGLECLRRRGIPDGEAHSCPGPLPTSYPFVQRFQDLYNTFRPHRSLQQRPPPHYLQSCLPELRLPQTVSEILIQDRDLMPNGPFSIITSLASVGCGAGGLQSPLFYWPKRRR